MCSSISWVKKTITLPQKTRQSHNKTTKQKKTHQKTQKTLGKKNKKKNKEEN